MEMNGLKPDVQRERDHYLSQSSMRCLDPRCKHALKFHIGNKHACMKKNCPCLLAMR